MEFRGLFIGIDRYQSAKINYLACARRDATALHALFSDNLGEKPKLLVDEQATRSSIESELIELGDTSPEDVVVISYSGHGSDTHALVPFDADPKQTEQTTIPLTRVTELLSKIPARRLVFILDCCFSGGMGTKVALLANGADSASGPGAFDETKLAELSGTGRIILTAAKPTEEAHEHSGLRHGFLTHHLIQALMGSMEVTSSGKVSVLRLLEFVTTQVIDSAKNAGLAQSPCIRASLDGELTWPIFKPGARFRAAFPERVPDQVSADIRSLSTFGFSQQTLDAWAAQIPTLNQLQIRAINEYQVLSGKDLVVSAPTSSGKTMIGEMAAVRCALERRRAIFLLPLKALVADKLDHFQRIHGPQGLCLLEATGETDDIEPLLRGRYDIALLTYEKFAAIALMYPHVLRQVGTIVVDEIQMLSDQSRGPGLEFLLTMIRARRKQGIQPQLIALSAVIGETNGLERWINARLLKSDERPVPLNEGLLTGSGSFRYVDSQTSEERRIEGVVQRRLDLDGSKSLLIPLVQKLVREGKQVIVFRETKGEARACARYLSQALELERADRAINRLPNGDLSRASTELRLALEHGTAFHISDLDRVERRVVEEEFRTRGTPLRVLTATTTLAMGVNTPAEAVVIVGLMHPGDKPYSIAEYKNLVGRAGRLGFSTSGVSYLLAPDHNSETRFWNQFVRATPEGINSHFVSPSTDARSLIIRILAASHRSTGDGLTESDIVDFLEGSFGAFQQTHRASQWKWSGDRLRSDIDSLVSYELCALNAQGRCELTALGRLAGESSMEIRSILRLIGAVRSLNRNSLSTPNLVAAAQVTKELDEVYFPINAKSTQKEPTAWTGVLIQQRIAPRLIAELQRSAKSPTEGILRMKRAAACLFFVSGRAMDDIEKEMTRFGRPDSASGPVRSVAGRTSDVLRTVFRMAALLHDAPEVIDRLQPILLRLELGIPALALRLASLMRGRLARGDYLNLLAADLCQPDQIRAATDDQLLHCLEGDASKVSQLRRTLSQATEAIGQPGIDVPLLEAFEE